MILALDNNAGLGDRNPMVAKRLIDEGGLLLDVREPREFDQKHIPGARLVPVAQLIQRLDDVVTMVDGDLERPIVVYCRSGARADRAKAMLQASGFSRVVNLGGVDDWPRLG